MKEITLSFAVLAAIIAVTIPQAGAVTQCAKPTLTPPGYSGTARNATVTIKTATAGAYLRYTLDGSTPTGGPSGHGALITAASGKVSFGFDARGKTLKAIAYKAGLVNSLIAVGNYVYESPR
ncbi:MAG TPA: chitobiase/beta-hexosaminidase C-terminal domain-containing protein [Candidatus Udaeobacter sp.]|nr:chitobiase/beta-hexosaminidase C-terminal domain-containing protein [Candidatus Udaeobacter sp.]